MQKTTAEWCIQWCRVLEGEGYSHWDAVELVIGAAVAINQQLKGV